VEPKGGEVELFRSGGCHTCPFVQKEREKKNNVGIGKDRVDLLKKRRTTGTNREGEDPKKTEPAEVLSRSQDPRTREVSERGGCGVAGSKLGGSFCSEKASTRVWETRRGKCYRVTVVRTSSVKE